MPSKDPYDILGVSRSATQSDIKAAYRRLAKETHPDRNPNDRKTAERRFKEIQAAYEVLGDSDRRAQFDRFGAGGPAPDVHTWAAGQGVPTETGNFDFGSLGDLTSIFEQFFSRGGGGVAPRRRAARRSGARGANIEADIELSFEEAVRGTQREIELSAGDPRNGRERIEFRVPAGVNDGQRIRVRNKGQDGPGGRGDLLLRCHVRPHAYFRQDGHDIYLDVPLTFAEAALGEPVEIPTLDGPTVVKVPPGTSSGTKLRLRGRGVHDPRTGQSGDLYAVVRIQVPKNITPRAQELIQALDRELPLQPRAALGWSKS